MGARIHAQSVTYHRNGVAGVGFHLVMFRHDRDRLYGIVFDADDANRECYTAVFEQGATGTGEPLETHMGQAVKHFRGDYFDAALLSTIRNAADAYDHAYDAEYDTTTAHA